jgi:hypothetical protein
MAKVGRREGDVGQFTYSSGFKGKAGMAEGWKDRVLTELLYAVADGGEAVLTEAERLIEIARNLTDSVSLISVTDPTLPTPSSPQ